MRTRLILIISTIFCLFNSVHAQDYFEDTKGEGNTVLNSMSGRGYYFATRINLGDNSIKLNIFRFYTLKDISAYKRSIGWGANIKGKAENGIGAVLGKSGISPGIQAGAYVAYQFIRKGTNTHWGTVVGHFNYSVSNLQIFDSSKVFKQQIYDTTFKGYGFGLTYFHVIPVGKGRASNIIPAISVDVARKNNYSDMDNVEIRTRREIFDPMSGKYYSYNDINQNGFEYGMGEYKERWETQLRLSLGWIPGSTNSRIAIIPFGSLKFKNNKESLSYGIGMHILEKGNPSTTIGGISFEFLDVNNTNNSKYDFLKRSFKVSLNAAISTISLK